MMTEQIVITPETIPAICERLQSMLAGRGYWTVDKRGNAEYNLQLDAVHEHGDFFHIVDSYGVHSVCPRYGPASIVFSEHGFTLRHMSPGGVDQEYTYTLEDGA